MVDTNKIAIADVLRHPTLGLVSHQPGFGEPISDRIHVRDLNWILHHTLASECELPTGDEITDYWKKVNDIIGRESSSKKGGL
jgi:hypothetical protein